MYYIKRTPFYYPGTITTDREGLLTDGDGILTFDSREEAEAYLAEIVEQQPDVYVLSHGEYARPEYKVISDEEIVDCLPGTGIDFYGFREVRRDELPESIVEQLEALSVDALQYEDGYEVWVADLDVNDKTYRIAYCPTNVALQKAYMMGDLGFLNWDNPGFYVED